MNIDKYAAWVSKGRRSVKIELETLTSPTTTPKVWCYDYDTQTGESVPLGQDPPDITRLISLRREQLQEELDRLVDAEEFPYTTKKD